MSWIFCIFTAYLFCHGSPNLLFHKKTVIGASIRRERILYMYSLREIGSWDCVGCFICGDKGWRTRGGGYQQPFRPPPEQLESGTSPYQMIESVQNRRLDYLLHVYLHLINRLFIHGIFLISHFFSSGMGASLSISSLSNYIPISPVCGDIYQQPTTIRFPAPPHPPSLPRCPHPLYIHSSFAPYPATLDSCFTAPLPLVSTPETTPPLLLNPHPLYLLVFLSHY